MKQDKQSGFTLIEMLVVVAIIGLLASVVVVGVGSARQRARDARRISDIRQIQNALENFYASNNAYPANATDLYDPSKVPGVPADPLDGTKHYGYQLGASNQTYLLGACLENDRPAGVSSVTDAFAVTNYGSCNCNTGTKVYCVKS